MRKIVLFAAAIGASLHAIPAAVRGDEDHGRLEVSEDVWDFGQVWFGPTLKKEIELRNAGATPLKILRIWTPCGCTKATGSKTRLDPGETDVLKIELDTKRTKRYPAHMVHVDTDDPERPRTSVFLKGEIRPIFEMEPRDALRLKGFHKEVAFERTFELKCLYDQPVKPELVCPENPFVDLAMTEVEPGRLYRVTMKSKPPMPVGDIDVAVKLKLPLNFAPELPLPMRGISMERAMHFPDEIYVPPNRLERSPYGLNLVYLKTRKMRITGMTSTLPGVEFKETREPVDLAGIPEYDHVRVGVVLPSGPEVPPGGGKIILKTDDPEFPEFVFVITPDEPEYLKDPVEREETE